jgi:hypothetical protein
VVVRLNITLRAVDFIAGPALASAGAGYLATAGGPSIQDWLTGIAMLTGAIWLIVRLVYSFARKESSLEETIKAQTMEISKLTTEIKEIRKTCYARGEILQAVAVHLDEAREGQEKN